MRGLGLLLVGLAIVASTSLGCPDGSDGLLLPARESPGLELEELTLVARFAHISDTHLMDEESPARFPGARVFTRAAWRPYESYSAQLFDGIIRTVNRIHTAGRNINFLVHTGDACDNVQSNELAWFLAVMDGQQVNPLTGLDDRAEEARPETTLDPHAAFQAQGLYRSGQHGDLPSIPWYLVFGNHDAYAIGTIPIFESAGEHRTAPLLLPGRPGFILPVRLDPLASSAYGNVTPGDPGPPPLFTQPRFVQPNQERAFFDDHEFIAALSNTVSEPAGHGFANSQGATWYSVSPAAGVCLIGLDTNNRAIEWPGHFYDEGAISREQLAFLRIELDAAQERDELVIVATHHPSSALRSGYGSETTGTEFRALLNEYPNVILHLAGHRHRNRVMEQGGYLEIETCSTLDLPQEGRLIEIWYNDVDSSVVVTYEMFMHLDDTLPALGEDPLRGLRETALAIARGDKGAEARQKRFDPSGEDPCGQPTDRQGAYVFGG